MAETEIKITKEEAAVPKPELSAEQQEQIIAEARQKFKECFENESEERAKMRDDLRFCTFEQWPDAVKQARENDVENGARPCLTIDKINQYIVQVVNDMRQGKPSIVVRPQDDKADVETAKVLKGIIRNIEDQSNADIAYMTGGESQVRIGVGYWRVMAEYISPDSFEQDLCIKPIFNSFSVYLGPHVFPDGSDARHAFIVEAMPEEAFKQKYPKANAERDAFDGIDSDAVNWWRTDKTVTVVEYYVLKRKAMELYYLADGTTMWKDMYDKWPADQGETPPVMDTRMSFKEQLCWYKMTGVEILEYRELPGQWIPIIKTVGRSAIVDGKWMYWGLVRPAKDALRMYNYWSSTITEKMALAPKTPFIGAKGQFRNMEDRWRQANVKNFSYLEYDPVEVHGQALPPPQRQGPTPIEAAMLQQLQVIEHDVQTSLGVFKAGLGEHEPQQSGRAILALQRESDTGTYHFAANLGLSIRHTGRILLDLIPHYYDTKRMVRILGDDGSMAAAQIDPNAEQQGVGGVFNPNLGRYDVTITVGPGYNTKRMEAAAVLTEISKSAPQLLQIFGDVLFRSLDFPYSDVIADRLRKMLPPEVQDDGDQTQQLMQQVQQMQQQIQAAEQTMQAMDEENTKLKAGVESDMAKIESQQVVKFAQIEADKEEFDKKMELEWYKAEQQLALNKWKAENQLDQSASTEGHRQALAEDDQQHRHQMDEESQEHAERMAERKSEKETATSD